MDLTHQLEPFLLIPSSILDSQRKNGLFKKAYELGVLCSVDVAVIIFGSSPPSRCLSLFLGFHERLIGLFLSFNRDTTRAWSQASWIFFIWYTQYHPATDQGMLIFHFKVSFIWGLAILSIKAILTWRFQQTSRVQQASLMTLEMRMEMTTTMRMHQRQSLTTGEEGKGDWRYPPVLYVFRFFSIAILQAWILEV